MEKFSQKYNKKAVLLVNLGTPNSYKVTDIKKYLKEFLSDPRVIEANPLIWQMILRLFILPFRSPKTAKLYQKVWRAQDDLSPLLYFTQQQTEKLSHVMDDSILVEFGMRYGEPAIETKINELQAQGVTEIKILPLYPQYSASTTASVYDEVYRVLKSLRWQPNIIGIAPYYDHPDYIKALKNSVENFIAKINFMPDILLLSFHGIPQAYFDKGDPYYCHCHKTYRLLKQSLSLLDFDVDLSFQSRFGPKKWLEPYTTEKLKNYPGVGKKNVIILTPGFASDCLETLEEIEETERETFMGAGGNNYAVIPCLNDSDEHISLLKLLSYS